MVGKFEVGFEFDAIQVECRMKDHEGSWDFFGEDEESDESEENEEMKEWEVFFDDKRILL